jgi:glutamine synthetase
MDEMLVHGVQTDGSSVDLPKIADLNNGKVDLVPDLTVNWFVDYNFDNIDLHTGLPVGTLRIPAYLVHNEKNEVGARSILKNAVEAFKAELMDLLRQNPYAFEYIHGVDSVDEIEEICITSATELEFWVKTPEDKADREQLSTSQELKEQYWKRTYGPVRTALEKSLEIIDCYGVGVEMGHKEVGGVKSQISSSGSHEHIMEQLEIDWKYADAMQAADNEKQVKYIIRDVFNQFGLHTTFMAKPIEGVAGSGKHTHLGVAAKLKNGKMANLFAAKNPTQDYLSPLGFGGLMGILRNYEAINPIVSSTTDSLNRLKPGYEAPVCIVTSLGKSVTEASRNRSILVGLIRDAKNPMATRFELRAPNPKSNTYMVLAASYMAMLDGIRAVLENGKTTAELEKSISKKYGEEDFYLDTDREYRSENNVFEDYTKEERDRLFGRAPATVWENLCALDTHRDRLHVLKEGHVMPTLVLKSYCEQTLAQWKTELHDRIIPDTMNVIRGCVKAHRDDDFSDYDIKNWLEIDRMRHEMAKDTINEKCLLTRAKEALDNGEFALASDLQLEIQRKLCDLTVKYAEYKKNLL